MFGNKKPDAPRPLNDSGRSLISETFSLEGTLRTSGAIDIAGLVKGPVYTNDLIIKETGSIIGPVETDKIEIHGHLDGKVSAEEITIGATGTVKGDIEFGNNLKTENGADIDGYIKRVNNGKANTDEDIAIEEIVERAQSKKPEIIPVATHKEAV